MKRILAALLCLLPAACLAGMQAYSFYISPVATNAVASTHSVSNISGHVLSLEIDVTTTCNVAVATSGTRGSSISGAKTLYTAADVVGGATKVFTNGAGVLAGPFLWTDVVTISATGAVGTTETVKVLLTTWQ